jgi:hypothetical protein
MADPESKAAGFNSTVATLREIVPAQFEAIVTALPSETAELVRRPPLPVAWIHGRHVRAVLEAACRVAFGGDVRAVVDLSRRARIADMSSIYRFFVRLSSVEFALSRAAKMYTTYTRNNGDLAVTGRGEGFAEITFSGLSDPNPIAWAYSEGAVRAVIELTGLKNGQVEAVRGGGKEPDCTFRIRWAD